ncbi:hypothetical protein NIES4072_69970 [Nostoc commune NIES-4072]|uniref:Uncharacterized protein n=1 Tax=Nostoc commune NIES-4072 TaxID=2005467 RepID=A0A2R5FYE1_NOSCO|nr:hypothetical protein [Nostoc commune]BBD70630.1 hypothetical protein NIES4070_70410 [Nostoc commune HK-02]GBG23285.1 hypothetical protein NIES4072_69970 [Nostoc commune NIES-4072]
MQEAFDIYTNNVSIARSRFDRGSTLKALLDPNIDPILLEMFLLYYCSQGIEMTEPVESWIRRAGERCIEIGLTEVGQLLIAHAKGEAGHQLMMIADTKALVSRWNSQRKPHLDAEWFFSQPKTDSVSEYYKLHEDTITGDTPFGQVAIEYEIEMLSLRCLSHLVEQCKKVLGNDITKCISFLEEHIIVDVAHTQLNERMIKNLLNSNPDYLTVLSSIASKALDTYGSCLSDCLNLAQAHRELYNFEARIQV